MKIDIITLFPEMFSGPLSESIIGRAQKRNLAEIKIHQLRKWAINKRGQVDDSPYGGGAGMVMRVDVAFKALKSFKNQKSKIKNQKFGMPSAYTILLTPKGKRFDQRLAQKLSKKEHLVFLCPHYEGYDHRIESLVDEKISIGDYILTGGELPAMVITDAVVRLIPGVIKPESLKEESFSKHDIPSESTINNSISYKLKAKSYLEYPQYTRPEIFEVEIEGNFSTSLGTRKIKKRVPKVLLSGNHALIAKWREKMRG